MRLLYLSDSLIPSSKANSVQVMKMCQAFALNGAEVTLLCRKGFGTEDIFSSYGVQQIFKVVQVNVPHIRIISRLWFLLKSLIFSYRCSPDFIYGREMFLISILGMTNILGGIPLVLEVHVPPKNKLQRKVLSLLFRASPFKGLVVITDSLRVEYLRLFGSVLKNRITVAHDGADLPQNTEVKVGLKSDKASIGYVGSLYAGKGIELIVGLAEICPEFQFHIVGGSVPEIKKWQAQLKSDNVVFHGFQNQAGVGKLMQAFDIMLAPYQQKVLGASGASDLSRWMSPLKIFEYMAAGKPMIASDLPVLLEVLKDGHNCLIAPSSSPSRWKSCLENLVNDENLRTRIVGNGFEELRRTYNWNSRAKMLLSLVS